MSAKADDVALLAQGKEENADRRKSDRKDGPIFKLIDYTAPNPADTEGIKQALNTALAPAGLYVQSVTDCGGHIRLKYSTFPVEDIAEKLNCYISNYSIAAGFGKASIVDQQELTNGRVRFVVARI